MPGKRFLMYFAEEVENSHILTRGPTLPSQTTRPSLEIMVVD
jgi:hypothetical protein